MIIDPNVLKSIPNSENQTCFACGPNNPSGLKMKFSTDGKRVYSLIHAPSTMTGWDQTVHGGILTTMLDEVMGWGVICLLKKIGITKSITVDFREGSGTPHIFTVFSLLAQNRLPRLSFHRGLPIDSHPIATDSISCTSRSC
jgi:hypothetical protein